uniref:GG17284 n=1 Tax=Drosophila erecta TaxID=7220 RepID=B3P1M8_DROER
MRSNWRYILPRICAAGTSTGDWVPPSPSPPALQLYSSPTPQLPSYVTDRRSRYAASDPWRLFWARAIGAPVKPRKTGIRDSQTGESKCQGAKWSAGALERWSGGFAV